MQQILYKETPEQIRARRPPKPRHHTISEESEREQLGRKQAWKQAQQTREPIALRPPRPTRIGDKARMERGPTFVSDVLGRTPTNKRPRGDNSGVVDMDANSFDEDDNAPQTKVPTSTTTTTTTTTHKMPSVKEQEAEAAEKAAAEKAEAEKLAAQKAALEKRVAEAKVAETERNAALAKRLATEMEAERQAAAEAEKAKLRKLGKKPVVPARTHTTPILGYLQAAFHPFVPSELPEARIRYSERWNMVLDRDDDPTRKATVAVRTISDLSDGCATTFRRRGDPVAYWMDNIVQELEQREWVNPIKKGTRKEEAHPQIMEAAFRYNLSVFAELLSVSSGNPVANRVELAVYNKERAANRAIIKQMTTRLHKWYAAQGITPEVHQVQEMIKAEDAAVARQAKTLQSYRDRICDPTDINTRLKDSEVMLRAQNRENEVFHKNQSAAITHEQKVKELVWRSGHVSFGLFTTSMGAVEVYVDHCKAATDHRSTRRAILNQNIKNSDAMTSALHKEVARQLEVVEQIKKRYWTPKLQACDDADAIAEWMSKRLKERQQVLDLWYRSKERGESLREMHARNQRLHDEWMSRYTSASSVRLLLHAHIAHASIVGAPLEWRSPIPTRSWATPGHVHVPAPPPPAAAANNNNDDDDDDDVEVVGAKSWEERDKELRAQATYVG